MDQLIAIFCDMDDFCKTFAPVYDRHLLHIGQRHRTRQTALALSEILTLLVYFPWSHYRTFKHDYTEYVAAHLRPYFPHARELSSFCRTPARERSSPCVALSPRAKGAAPGLPSSTRRRCAVCDNHRIATHKVFEGVAARGKTSMGWFYGFKLHLIVNDEGELLAFRADARQCRRPSARRATRHRAGWPALWGPGLYLPSLA